MRAQAASIKGRLQAFNQSISQQVVACMRDPSRMVRQIQMQMRGSAVGVFGTVLKGELCATLKIILNCILMLLHKLMLTLNFWMTQNFLRQLTQHLLTAFYSLKKMQSMKRKIVDRRASESQDKGNV
uniref:uncharacterized protein LOC105352969 n=1 Tax=Fragaria vesca subsp. vesca TaxID=101020 RepID=UPI0005CA5A15|nr:PREDICTED: uncharacterized protein LOC105352969 [Fragaria vesca subsp. vesca]